MYYVREHAINRLIQRVDKVDREVAKNKILETMLFYDKKTTHPNPRLLMVAYLNLKGEMIVISKVDGNDQRAVTTISLKNIDNKSWWAKALLA